MILPIYIYGNKILEQPGQVVDKEYPNLNELIENMFETMTAASGIGLAAHQIGLPLRLFIVDIRHYAQGDAALTDFKKVFINSEVIETEGEPSLFEEGCLSIPGIHVKIPRPPKIKLKYQDENFVEHEEWFDGLPARCILHEHDHTEGIMFTKKLSPIRMRLLASKLKTIAKEKFVTNYRYKL